MNKVLENLIPTAKMLEETIGADCRIVLYDLNGGNTPIVYASDGCVGDTELMRHVAGIVGQSLAGQGKDYSGNHMFITEDLRLIRSSIALIKDDANRVCGAFCMLVNTKKTEKFVSWLLETIREPLEMEENDVPVFHPLTPQEPVEISHVSRVVDELIEQSMQGQSAEEMSREDKINVVHIMEQKGLFLVKGAIEKVSAKLGIAKVTVYSYLDELKDKRDK